MAIEIGAFRVMASTTRTEGVFRGYWHVWMRDKDGKRDAFRDQPTPGTYATEDEARQAAMDAGAAYAQDLHEKNPTLKPYSDD